MADISEVTRLIETQGAAWQSFSAKTAERFETIEDEIMRLKRPGVMSNGAGSIGNTAALGEAVRKALSGDDRELKAMSVGTDSEGGYLVVPYMDGRVRQIRDMVSPVSALARTIELTGGAEALLPRAVGTLPSGWVGENTTRPVTDSLALGMDRVDLHEVYAMPQVSQKLLDTASYDVGALLVDQIAHGLAVAESVAIHSGNGIARPRGFTTVDTASTADTTRTWGVVQHVATGNSGAFASSNPADTLIDAVTALAPRYRANARWLINRSTAGLIRKFKESTTNAYIWQPGLQAGVPDLLLGYPVSISDDVPDVSANSLSVWFGDFAQAYCIVRRPGLKLLRDPYSTKGQVAFYAYQRVGGGLVDSCAVKAVKFATS